MIQSWKHHLWVWRRQIIYLCATSSIIPVLAMHCFSAPILPSSLSLLYVLCSISSRSCCFALCSRIDSCKVFLHCYCPHVHSSNHFDNDTMLVLITKQYKSEFWCGFSVVSSQVVQKFFPVLFKKRAQAPAADKFCVNVSFLIRSAWHMQFQYFMSVEEEEHDCRASKLQNAEHAFCTQWGSFLASYVIVFVEHVVGN